MADAAAGPDDGIGIPAGADAGASTGVAGALATTDAEGSDGSEAGVAKLAGAVVVEGGAASCGCFEQAASVKSNADEKTKGADFMEWLSKSSTVLHGRLAAYLAERRLIVPSVGRRVRRITGQLDWLPHACLTRDYVTQ